MGLARGAGQCTRSLDRLKTKNPACAAVKREGGGGLGVVTTIPAWAERQLETGNVSVPLSPFSLSRLKPE
jgi:hypothetical protein